MYEKKKDLFFEKELWIKSNAEEYIKQVEEQERQERCGIHVLIHNVDSTYSRNLS